MARKQKKYDDDDGHTIVDMSGVGRAPLIIPHGQAESAPKRDRQPEPEHKREDRPWEESPLTREERRWYILGALKASLLIALVFIVGLGAAILVMLWAWT